MIPSVQDQLRLEKENKKEKEAIAVIPYFHYGS